VPQSPLTQARFAAIDALKAAGIVCVVFVHALPAPWQPSASPLAIWLGHLTRFGVPAFLFASGFLYATRSRVPAATTWRRLRRILAPYLVASLLAQLWRITAHAPSNAGSTWADLLLGSSFGPYYYVFVIALLVALTPLFARAAPRHLAALLLILLVCQWCVDAALLLPLPFYWHLRNPLLWWPFFALGWLARLHREALDTWLARGRRETCAALAAGIGLLAAAAALDGHAPRLLVRSAAWLEIYAVLGLIYAWACARPEPAPLLRGASQASYAVYLFHPFFVLAAQIAANAWLGDLEPFAVALAWAAGLLGPALLVIAARRLLGARSLDVIGA